MKQQKRQKINKYEKDLPLKQKNRPVKEKYRHSSVWLEDESDDDTSSPFFEAGKPK